MSGIEPSFWDELRRSTRARIGLGRTGDSLPTRRVLEFRSAHAAARDAVHMPLDVGALAAQVREIGIGEPAVVTSRASSRGEYLRRPDLGRVPRDVSSIPEGEFDVGFVLADGLSPRALMDHGAGLLGAMVSELAELYSLAPPVIATEARVALGDHLARAMGARTIAVIIGERPGLSVADSLGIYLTHLPSPGTPDSGRNCISNIHPPDGLDYARSAHIVARLIAGARELGASGVALKDTSRAAGVEAGDTLTVEGEASDTRTPE
ncbi:MULTISPECIES: ethanolamine ammonia-lyase subunit EutC [unclassified Dietzia]|uniref:ethanolamine ammonia-lyase subunit EutC n=1 Tax=unclassified Dietzia TaxID=2617939 RepID=UPI000D22A447|nr:MULTISPECIES: ethanolamine ammonia-lyase subunit EutC [unclassified Dietzia]AVZ40770.1 ethanolamine ammonia-lyase [Dietzia sp. JS16-p6b]QGW26367.1 ethanolamine ammonia-lyase small subunit [Dietzia sp. DQ12-45-1b]